MWIEAIRVEGGVLDGLEQSFSSQLNVLIGGRGTGKSSVVELLRFCLGAKSYTDLEQQEALAHALGVLGDGKVTVTLRDGDERVQVSRTALDEAPDAQGPVAPLSVFSQSEIESIGLQGQSRLRLIDDFLARERKQASTARVTVARIESTTAEIRALLSEIDEISEKTADLPAVQAQLDAVKAQSSSQTNVSKEIETHRKALAEVTPLVAASHVRAEVIVRTCDRVTSFVEALEDLLDRKPKVEAWPSQSGTTDELKDIRRREIAATDKIKAGLGEFREIVAELESKLTIAVNQKTGLENRSREIRQKIEEKQRGASALDKHIGELTQRVSVLQSLIELREERAQRVSALTSQRAKLLEQQEKLRNERTSQRERVAKRLNAELTPSVRVTVKPYSERRQYVSALAAALRGSGLRYAELAERISETFSPQEIAQLAESRDVSTIASTLGITEDRARRLSDGLRGAEGTPLLTAVVEDDIQIELMDGAAFKGIDFLSTGQRCTAILPIVLCHSDRIIILDQPEDHLDNAFVVETLVKAVLARTGSQTIIATHNPNIPVLGDADRVVHLDSDGSRCFVRSEGPLKSRAIVSAITTIMEGGRAAFSKRADFYAKNLPDVRKS